MSPRVRAVAGFKRFADPQLITTGRGVVKEMKDNPNFPNPPEELKTLESAVDEELRDYQAYIDCQKMVERSYADRESWTTMSILNAARIGTFSSDRAIREYCRDIWNIPVDQAPPA